MNRTELAMLLQRITAYDRKFAVDEPTIAAWSTAADTAGWSYDEAVRAVDRYFAAPLQPGEARWIEPGHITHLIRADRPWPPRWSDLKALDAPEPASPEARQAAKRQLHDALRRKAARRDSAAS